MRLLWILALLGTVACGGAPGDDEILGRGRSAIVGGSDSTSADDAVVALAIRSSGTLHESCSATLLAPNLVLTARHCVTHTDEQILCKADGTPTAGGKTYTDHEPSDLSIYVGVRALGDIDADGDEPSHTAAIGRRIFTDGSPTMCNADIALVLLDRDVKGTYAAISEDPVKEGSTLEAVGFGITASGKLPAARQKRDVTVAIVGPHAFDALTGVGDREIVTTEGACSGDSGGPLFDANHAVVGVVSYTAFGTGTGDAAQCTGGARAFYGVASKAKDLIDGALVVAKSTPPAEPAPPVKPAPPQPPSSTTIAPPSGGSGGCSSTGGAPSGGVIVLLLALLLVRRVR